MKPIAPNRQAILAAGGNLPPTVRTELITVREASVVDLIMIDRGTMHINDLKQKFSGTEAECEEYCEAFGFQKVGDGSVFGYYYAHPEGGQVLLLV